jgi:hypothetical protein
VFPTESGKLSIRARNFEKIGIGFGKKFVKIGRRGIPGIEPGIPDRFSTRSKMNWDPNRVREIFNLLKIYKYIKMLETDFNIGFIQS